MDAKLFEGLLEELLGCDPDAVLIGVPGESSAKSRLILEAACDPYPYGVDDFRSEGGTD